MATLNQAETETLRQARTEISGVLRVLNDPEAAITAKTRTSMVEVLKQADAKIKTVITMKGYYPK